MKLHSVVLTLLVFTPLLALGDEWHHEWQVSNNPELQVDAGDAAIDIHTGSTGEIRALVTTRNWAIGADGIRIDQQQNGNHVTLSVKEPHTHFSFGNHSVKVDITVPRDLSASLHTGDGPISVRGVHGSVRANTGDGPVRIEDFDGTLDAQTGDGPVNLRGRFEDLRIQTGDGPVDISAMPGSKIRNSWRVQTGDGPVQFRVPQDLSANLDLHTGDGPIHLDLPLTVNGTQDHHNMHGRLNGGGPAFEIHTGDGPISIGRS